MQPLEGQLVVDLTRNLPGPYATRELLRLGARVVRLEAPDGDPVRDVAPHWDDRLNCGKESVVWDAKRDPAFGPALCARADVVVEGFRPGVADRLGVGPGAVPPSTVYCSITGFGEDDGRVGHDLNYMGWAGALEHTAPALPPLPVADLAAGALTAVTQILAALLERERTGRGARLVVSMTHGAHELGRYSAPLTGQLACYRIYRCADGGFLTVAALEPKFFARLCELIGRPELVERHNDRDQEALAAELGAIFGSRPLAGWLELFDGEDVAAGPVVRHEDAAAAYGTELDAPPPELGAHTEAWRRELGIGLRGG